MRLIRFHQNGQTKPGLLKRDKIVDLTRLFPDIPDIDEDFFNQGWMEKVATVTDPGEVLDVTITCPVSRPSKIICLGKNYEEHAKEGGGEKPDKPILFSKSLNALNGPFDPILLPKRHAQVDFEVELALIIGKKAKEIKKNEAFQYIAGFTVMNDVSERLAQFSDGQWYRGKSLDTFAPLGPAIVTCDEIEEVGNLQLKTLVDGEIMQDGNTRDLIFKIPYLMEYISEDITLFPGDIIATGTPSGVGIFRNPPVLLKPGNTVECYIEGIGSIINPVV